MNHTPIPGLPETTELIGFVVGPFETNCFVLIDHANTTSDGSASATVIDPGYGAADVLATLSEEKNFTVTNVVLTHGHIDHIRDAGTLGVPVQIHELDEPVMTQDLSGSPFAPLFDVDSMSLPDTVSYLEDTVEMGGTTWTVHHMPGHSPGHVMFRVDGLIIGGDVLFKGGIGRTDLPFSSPEDMMLSLKKLGVEFNDADVVLPGHGPQTTIGEEKATNSYLSSVV
ncbi:MBL fold metallo-hydrolase [Corynebacterium sp. zg254]|uniref:MBL fold metallo-hydrolase n=1 Tax=Corynebacterium zhongnanshanii TaxID=2768834 RepID=A0ABQ6VJW1_9CORY|nr:MULTISPECIES: MBL fold metallo-hydrolase [Corynebacterium]KAB3523431.1 MBL fold metallo-hydrolase [Corynebacterium zhongnanshanii]MCR5913430.1 MBL fold metallo-hydrolase [Corynebacterium sp. zg254]